MKTIFVLFFSLLLSHGIMGQTTPSSRIVLLKDGSLLKGIVLEENNNGTLKIALKSGDELEIPYALVQSIKKDKHQEVVFSNGTKSKTKGFYQFIQFGLLPGYSNEEQDQFLWGLTGRYTTAYRFHSLLSVGAGVGADYYNQFMLPLFGQVSGHFFKKAVSPYYSFSAGYSFPFQLKEDLIEKKGGLMVNPAIGLRIARAKYVFSIDGGYQIQKATAFREDWGGGTTTDRISFRRWVIRVGWEF